MRAYGLHILVCLVFVHALRRSPVARFPWYLSAVYHLTSDRAAGHVEDDAAGRASGSGHLHRRGAQRSRVCRGRLRRGELGMFVLKVIEMGC